VCIRWVRLRTTTYYYVMLSPPTPPPLETDYCMWDYFQQIMSSLWHWLSKERWFPWWWKQRIKTSSHTSFLFIFGKGVLRVLSGWSARSERKRDSEEEMENVWFRPGHMMIQTWEKSIVSALSQQRTPTIQLSCQPRLSGKLQEEPLNVLHPPPTLAIVISFFSLTLLLISLSADAWFSWIHCN